FLARRRRWLARSPGFPWCGSSLNECDEPGLRCFSILGLGTVLPAVDDEDSFARHSAASQCREPFFHRGWQSRSSDVETQFNRCGDLVDVLAARARGADELFFDVRIVENDRIGDSDHGRQDARGESAGAEPMGSTASLAI